jgi:hypothetical protein
VRRLTTMFAMALSVALPAVAESQRHPSDCDAKSTRQTSSCSAPAEQPAAEPKAPARASRQTYRATSRHAVRRTPAQTSNQPSRLQEILGLLGSLDFGKHAPAASRSPLPLTAWAPASAEAQSQAEAPSHNVWRFAHVLDAFPDRPKAVGAFTFAADGSYTFNAEVNGRRIVEQQGYYRLDTARFGELPRLSLTPTGARVGDVALADAMTSAGLVKPTAADFYIELSATGDARLFTDDCPRGCLSYTHLTR